MKDALVNLAFPPGGVEPRAALERVAGFPEHARATARARFPLKQAYLHAARRQQRSRSQPAYPTTDDDNFVRHKKADVRCWMLVIRSSGLEAITKPTFSPFFYRLFEVLGYVLIS